MHWRWCLDKTDVNVLPCYLMPKFFPWVAGVPACLVAGTLLMLPPVIALDLEPKVVGSNSVAAGSATEVTVSGNYAYVVVFESGFHIIDISDPNKPQAVGGHRAAGYAMDVVVAGSYAYLTTDRRFELTNYVGGGLDVVDISNPASPRLVGRYSSPGAGAVAVSGNHAYVAEETGLRVIDISNPAVPQVVGDIAINASAVAISGNYAYVVQLNQALYVFDVSDPPNPEFVGAYTTNGYFQDVVVSGSYAYLADRITGVHIVDVTEPTAPQLVGKYGSSAYDLAISGSYVYVATQPRILGTNNFPGGLHLVRVSEPTNPRLAGRYDAINTLSVAASAHDAYVVDGNALAAIDVADPASPSLVGGYPVERDARDVAVSGRYAYVADGVAGLEVFDISNPENPERAGGWFVGAPANSVALLGNHALLVAGGAVLVFDISDPATPARVARYDVGDDARKVTVAGHFAYVTSKPTTNSVGGGLHVIDINNPANPQRVGGYSNTSAVDVAIVGNYAYLTAAPSAGGGVIQAPGVLEVIDISNPATPHRVGQLIMAERTQGIVVSGEYAYVADGRAGLQVINISDPAKPELVGNFEPTSDPIPARGPGGFVVSMFTCVTVVGSRCYVAEMFLELGHGIRPLGSSVQIIDISEPTRPKRVGSVHVGDYDTSRPFVFDSHAQGMMVSGNHMFLAGSKAGLQALDITSPAAAQVVASFHPGGYAPGITVADSYIYVAERRRWSGTNYVGGGLQIIDVSNPSNPSRVGGYAVGDATDVAVSGTNACVLAGGLVHVLDVSDPANPRPAGSYNTSGSLVRIEISGNHAYVVSKPFSNRGGLHVISFSDPVNPQRIGGYDSGGEAFDVAVSGSYAYMAQGPRSTATNVVSGGLLVINIDNPANPQQVGAYHVNGAVHGVTVSGSYAYVAGPGIGLNVLDLGNPANPQRVGAYEAIDGAQAVAVSRDYAYVLDSEARLHVLDIRDAAQPKRHGANTSFTGFYNGSPSTVAVTGDTVYVGAGNKGLFVLHAYQPIRFQQIAAEGGSMHLRIAGPPGVPGRVQRSGDLINWTDWRPVSFGADPISLVDSDADSKAFYRIAVP